MSIQSRFRVADAPNLSVDKTYYRVVLTRGSEYPNGELATWLGERSLYQDHPLTKKLPRNFTRQALDRLLSDLDSAAKEFVTAPHNSSIIFMIIAVPEASTGSAAVTFMCHRKDGNPEIGLQHLEPFISRRFPEGNWQLHVRRLSLPKKKAAILPEVKVFGTIMRDCVLTGNCAGTT